MAKQKTTNENTRRDNGSGTFVKRSDGRWMGKIMVGHTPEGKPSFLYSYGKTETEAKRKLKVKIQEHNDKRGATTDIISVKRWFELWLENTMKPTLKPKSYDIKKRCVDRFIVPHLGGMKVEQVTSGDVQALINDMIKDNYSYSQIQKVYNTISQRYRQAIEERQLTYNPAVGVKLPKNLKNQEEMQSAKAMSKEEVKKLLARAYEKYPCGTPIYPRADLIVLLLQTGMRVGEALALTWEDVDLEEGFISINKNLVTVTNEDKTKINPKTNKPFSRITIIQSTPKTAKSYRKIPISNNALNTLKNIQSYNGNFEYVYASASGKPTDYDSLKRTLNSMIKYAGITEGVYSLHSLRHTFASLLFAQGVNDRYISEILGHSSLSVTHKVYIHIINELKNKEINKAMLDIDIDSE